MVAHLTMILLIYLWRQWRFMSCITVICPIRNPKASSKSCSFLPIRYNGSKVLYGRFAGSCFIVERALR